MPDMTQPPGQVCRYCGREMTCSTSAYAENPFCAVCYDDRMAEAVAENPVTHFEIHGDYIVPIRRRLEVLR